MRHLQPARAQIATARQQGLLRCSIHIAGEQQTLALRLYLEQAGRGITRRRITPTPGGENHAIPRPACTIDAGLRLQRPRQVGWLATCHPRYGHAPDHRLGTAGMIAVGVTKQ